MSALAVLPGPSLTCADPLTHAQSLGAVDGAPLPAERAPRNAYDVLRTVPATAGYLGALLGTSLLLALVSEQSVYRLVASASTNLTNMSTHPLVVLIASAFWVPSAWTFWPMAALLLAVMAPIERRLGTARTLATFAAGHIGATVVTVVGIAVAVSRVGCRSRSAPRSTSARAMGSSPSPPP